MEISHGINFFCRVKFEKSNLIKKGYIIGILCIDYRDTYKKKKTIHVLYSYYIIFE